MALIDRSNQPEVIWYYSVDDLPDDATERYDILKIYFQNSNNKHNAELQRANPGTTVTGYFSTRGHIFPHNG